MTNTAIRLIAVFTLVTVFIAHADDRERRGQRGQSDQRRGGDGDGRRDVNWDAIKSRVEAGVKSGRITREQANRIYEGLRRRMGGEAAKRDSGNDRDRMEEARKGYEIRRKRIEEGVRSGKIKREDAARMLRDLRTRMEAASRGRDRDDDNRDRKRTGDIVDVAAGNKSFGTLVAAVKAAGLVDTLKGKGPYTVFAPTDKAFSKLPKGTVESLLKPENRKKLVSILTYHVVPGKVLAKDVKSGRVKTANGSSLDVRVSRGGVTVNKAKVVATDVMASNGVIHVIDSVIIPSSRESQASDRRKAWEERIKKAREERERAERSSRGRDDDRREQMRRAWEERMKKAREDRERAERSSRGRDDDRREQMRKEWEERVKRWREMRERGREREDDDGRGRRDWGRRDEDDRDRRDWDRRDRDDDRREQMRRAIGEWIERIREMRERGRDRDDDDRDRRDWGRRGRDDDRGEQMRKEWEERMKKAREAREKAERDSRRAPQSRGWSRTPQRSSGADWRKAIEERMKKAREDRERAERSSRGRDDDRREQMRKEWEERMKRWREMQNRGSRWGGPRRR